MLYRYPPADVAEAVRRILAPLPVRRVFLTSGLYATARLDVDGVEYRTVPDEAVARAIHTARVPPPR